MPSAIGATLIRVHLVVASPRRVVALPVESRQPVDQLVVASRARVGPEVASACSTVALAGSTRAPFSTRAA